MVNLKKCGGIGLLALGVSLGSGYSYCYFSLHNAYQEKKYVYAETLALQYRYFIPGAYKITLKSAIEHSIKKRLAKERRYLIIDPTLRTFHLGLSTYMKQEQIDSSQEPIIKLYRKLKEYSQFTLPLYVSPADIKVEIYEDLAAIAVNVDFRNKDIYINSCYTNNLKKRLLYIENKIKSSLSSEGYKCSSR